MTNIYLAMFIMSIISLIYVSMYNYKNIEPYFWGISVTVPISILGYYLSSVAVGRDGFYTAYSFAFIDQTFIASLIFVCVMKEMRINLRRSIRIVVYGINFVTYLIAVLPGTREIYFAKTKLVDTLLGRKVQFDVGPLMIFHRVFLALLVGVMIWKRIELGLKGKRFSKHFVTPYFTIIVAGIGATMLQEVFGVQYSLAPILYGVGVTYLGYFYRGKYTHDIVAIVTNIFGGNEKNAYVAFDNNHRLISANDLALKIFPKLSEMAIDSVIPEEEKELYRIFEKSLCDIDDGKKVELFENINELNYRITTKYYSLDSNNSTSGVVFRIEDYTIQQSHEDLLQSYDDTLQTEVEKRTRQYKKIQQGVELRVADIIESRNSLNTGHAKRISDITKILVDIMAENKMENLTYDKAEIIVRAASLYDIGKMSIGDELLCKPGKLTDEEYEMIKAHTERGADIVRKMFEDLENEDFLSTAFNVAMYHHEKYDGSGYPEGLKGDSIPLEARIISIADVYDALVTKRCYKDPMSFDEASKEILDGMGTQFDPSMKKLFQLSKSRIEGYYKNNMN